MYLFISGGIVMACLVAGLFFLRFWRETRDRFFVFFALAFWSLGVNRLALAFTAETYEARSLFYLVRLLAFGLILIAIVDKNRARHQQ